MSLLSKSFLGASALTLICSGAVTAQDGYFNISYNDISFDVTLLGAYGEIVVSPSGAGNLGFGSCTMNFTRDEAGNVKDVAPIVQGSSANCPDELAFSISPGKEGRYNLAFSKGGELVGHDFELFPSLVPMTDELRITPPAGFDVLGMTIGQTRAEIEAILHEKGYARLDGYTANNEYQGGYSKAQEVWARGESDRYEGQPSDLIAVTYTAVFVDEANDEKVEYLARDWRINAADNLALAALKKSLDDKHGVTTSGFEGRYYDRAGNLVPKAFQVVCDQTVHLQKVQSGFHFITSSSELHLQPSCGASIKVMTGESYEAPGRAEFLKLELERGDVAYESFWNTWSRSEEKALKERYELQANMNTSGPEL